MINEPADKIDRPECQPQPLDGNPPGGLLAALQTYLKARSNRKPRPEKVKGAKRKFNQRLQAAKLKAAKERLG